MYQFYVTLKVHMQHCNPTAVEIDGAKIGRTGKTFQRVLLGGPDLKSWYSAGRFGIRFKCSATEKLLWVAEIGSWVAISGLQKENYFARVFGTLAVCPISSLPFLALGKDMLMCICHIYTNSQILSPGFQNVRFGVGSGFSIVLVPKATYKLLIPKRTGQPVSHRLKTEVHCFHKI